MVKHRKQTREKLKKFAANYTDDSMPDITKAGLINK